MVLARLLLAALLFLSAYGEYECDSQQACALEQFFYATGGCNWKRNDNWLVNPHICSWYGVQCDGGGVSRLSLYNNGLEGKIPTNIGLLISATTIELSSNRLEGTIPNNFSMISGLQRLLLDHNDLIGTISTQICSLKSLIMLWADCTSQEVSCSCCTACFGTPPTDPPTPSPTKHCQKDDPDWGISTNGHSCEFYTQNQGILCSTGVNSTGYPAYLACCACKSINQPSPPSYTKPPYPYYGRSSLLINGSTRQQVAPGCPKPPTKAPTKSPTKKPISKAPTKAPITKAPTKKPVTQAPTKAPTKKPITLAPTKSPTKKPTTQTPTKAPIKVDLQKTPAPVTPTKTPTKKPVTQAPTKAPTKKPTTKAPTEVPTNIDVQVTPAPVISTPGPTSVTTPSPVITPSTPAPNTPMIPEPTTAAPTAHFPSLVPSTAPSLLQSLNPSKDQSKLPTSHPSLSPSQVPTLSIVPTTETKVPSGLPSARPSINMTTTKALVVSNLNVPANEANLDTFRQSISNFQEKMLDQFFLEGFCTFDRQCQSSKSLGAYSPLLTVTSIESELLEGICISNSNEEVCKAVSTEIIIEHYEPKYSVKQVQLIIFSVFRSVLQNIPNQSQHDSFKSTIVTAKVNVVLCGVEPEPMSDLEKEIFQDVSFEFLEPKLFEYDPSVPIELKSVKIISVTYNIDSCPAIFEGTRSLQVEKPSSVIIGLEITGQYLPPPDIEFSGIVIDIYDDGGDKFIESLQKEEQNKNTTYFEGVNEVSVSPIQVIVFSSVLSVHSYTFLTVFVTVSSALLMAIAIMKSN